MAGFRPRVPFVDVIRRLNLDSGLKLCLDAGDANSYSSGQKWLDVSGNSYDFFLGDDATSESDDPTFNGSAGGLSTSEYFSFDGADGANGDHFTYDSVSESWIDNLHKDNVKLTIITWIYLASTANQAFCGNTQGLATTVGIEFGINVTNQMRYRVSNGSGSFALTFSRSDSVSTGTWPVAGRSAAARRAPRYGFARRRPLGERQWQTSHRRSPGARRSADREEDHGCHRAGAAGR
jgi:hypothetical protein